MEKQHKVIIVGGGFGGLHAAQHLKHAPVQVTVVDRRNYHLFQPLLYQVATGGLSPANIAAPLRSILKRQRNTEAIMGEAVDVDLDNQRLLLTDGELPYDTLIVASGASHQYFGHDEWEAFAPGLKTIEDATDIRRRILMAFEAAERETNPEAIRALLTFVIVGGGPTGVEMAGALCEIAHHTLLHEFRHINPSEARIILVERDGRILPPYSPKLSRKAESQLAALGATVLDNTSVTHISDKNITLKNEKTGKEEVIPARTVVWAAGIQASPLGKRIAEHIGIETDRAGRIPVGPELTVQGHPEVFVIGDLAIAQARDGSHLPGIAPVAIQQGEFVARTIAKRLSGRPVKPFHYINLGSMATIGRSAAVAHIAGVELSGRLAWLMWLFVHLMSLVQFEDRILVFIQWAWGYLTRNRAARLITGDTPFAPRHGGAGEGHP